MANITYPAGIATAYGAAVRGGYTGTYDDFCRQQAQYAESAAAVEQAKEDAEAAASAADTSKTAAAGSATEAATSAGQASTSATNAANSATEANTSKNAAATSATEAENSATSAAGSAATAQNVLNSIPPSYAVLADDVADLKSDFDKAIKIDYNGTSYYKKETIDDNALLIDIRDSFKSLTDEAINGITYGDLFGASHNITAFLDFESGSYSPAVRNAGNPTVTNEDSYSNPYSLKCFGTTSQQLYAEVSFEANHYYYLAVFAKVSRYSQGWAGALFSSSYPANFSRTTSGFELASRIISTDGTGSTYIYFGSGSSANLDAYLDNITFIDITSMFDDFSDTTAIQNTMDTLFKEYVDICNSNYNAKTFRIPTQNKSTFIGAILGATSPSDRWTAMKELYEVGQKLLIDPTYQSSDADLAHASGGAVCVMPENLPCMYEQYPVDILYSKNGNTQAIPASTTKVMSLVTGLDFITDINERVTIITADIKDGTPVFQNGDIVTIKDLIYGMMLPSSNTCANTFARICGEKILISQNGSGTYTPTECTNAFIAQMAVKSAEIGLTNSVWVSPSGLSSSNKTTPKDMIRVLIEACSYNEIQKVWNKKNYTINVKGSNARTETIQTSVTDVSFETDYYIFGGKTGTLYLDDDTIVTLMLIAKEM